MSPWEAGPEALGASVSASISPKSSRGHSQPLSANLVVEEGTGQLAQDLLIIAARVCEQRYWVPPVVVLLADSAPLEPFFPNTGPPCLSRRSPSPRGVSVGPPILPLLQAFGGSALVLFTGTSLLSKKLLDRFVFNYSSLGCGTSLRFPQ